MNQCNEFYVVIFVVLLLLLLFCGDDMLVMCRQWMLMVGINGWLEAGQAK